jgi:proteasome lid subunit RPN8/RPN11
MIQLPRTIVNQILTHAQHSPEDEVCGLIASRGGVPSRCYPVANISDEPDHLFNMDPKQQIDTMRTMRENGEDIFAIYHSHPHAPAIPSKTDIRQAAYPEALYLIISLDTKGVLEMQGFRIKQGDIVIEELEVL